MNHLKLSYARVGYVIAFLLVWGSVWVIHKNPHRLPQKRANAIIVRDAKLLPVFPETCGKLQVLLSGAGKKGDFAPAESYLVDIEKADPHYHERTTEFYYVLSGSGRLNLKDRDGGHFRSLPLSPGMAAVIPPNTFHQGVEGKKGMKVIVTCMPKELAEYAGIAKTYSLRAGKTSDNKIPSVMKVNVFARSHKIEASSESTFYYVLEGSGSLKVDDRSFGLEEGRSLFIPAGNASAFQPKPSHPLKVLVISMKSTEPTLGIMPSSYSKGDIHLEGGGVGGIKGKEITKK
jgi:mannose-6-phosphate isomerase-like protein (cupin superfamily)